VAAFICATLRGNLHYSRNNLVDPSAADIRGLTTAEARRRLAEFGPNQIKSERRSAISVLLLGQFKSPIILILIGAAIVSLFLQAHTDATLILSFVLISGLLGFLAGTRSDKRSRKASCNGGD
jgi:Mg2+-importing ATPase